MRKLGCAPSIGWARSRNVGSLQPVGTEEEGSAIAGVRGGESEKAYVICATGMVREPYPLELTLPGETPAPRQKILSLLVKLLA